jgi:hypothetical protein
MVNYNVFAASCIGTNHIKAGTVCQDFSACYQDDNMALIALADGHGSPLYFHSDRGARFACEAAIKCIRELVVKEPADDSDEFYRNLASLIKTAWDRRVIDDWDRSKNPAANLPPDGSMQFDFTDTGYPELAYGTTLLAACVTEDFFFALQIGDGRCVIQTQDGAGNTRWGEPVPWDERCFFNVTTSLCEPDAVDSFRHYYACRTEIPRAVFLGTDGVDNSFPMENNEVHLARLYNSIAATCAGEGIDACKKQVEEFLPQLTERGSGDDVSIAGIILEE